MQEKVIYSLKENKGYLSGQEISRSLNISRAGIWKYMQELRRYGYEIEAVSHKGYRLLSVPDKLLPWEIKYGLKTKIVGRTVICKEEVTSTMDEAFRLGFDGAEDGTVVCAESQLKGRGRMGRGWVSPSGKGIYMSIILRPKLSPRDVAKLTLLSAVAVCEALKKITNINVTIKWPNDLLVGQRKLVGILTEMSAEVDRVKFIVLGLGINVNSIRKDLPEEATSIKIETKKVFSRNEIIKEILRSLDKWYNAIDKQGFGPVLDKWREYSATLGRRVKVSDAGKSITGVAIDLDEDGGLLIKDDKGKITKKMSGNVVLIK